MKNLFYLLFVSLFAVAFGACSNSDDNRDLNTDKNIELRAATLGYPDVATYKAAVVNQCAAGNHENCDILTNGTHQACSHVEHIGIKHDGSHHSGVHHTTDHHTDGHH